MVKNETDIEKRANLIIKYRKMKVRKKEEEGDLITYQLTKGDRRCIMHRVRNQRNVGIARAQV